LKWNREGNGKRDIFRTGKISDGMFSRVRGEPDGFRFLPSKGNNNSVPPAQDRAVSGGTGKIITAVIRHDPL